MPEKPMSPERAIIVLNNLNTDGRIEVDRDELRAAVKTAQEALRKKIAEEVILSRFGLPANVWWNNPSFEIHYNIRSEEDEFDHCDVCGQALDRDE